MVGLEDAGRYDDDYTERGNKRGESKRRDKRWEKKVRKVCKKRFNRGRVRKDREF